MSAREGHNKHLYRPNTYLHKWWARRSGTCFRHILKGFVSNPAKRDFYEAGGLEGLTILDPMMGGGTTLHEAVRLGARVVGMDIDPVPVVQARAALQDMPAWKKKAAFDAFFGELRRKVGHLFMTRCPVCNEPVPFRFVLYGRRKRCACGSVVMVDSLVLREQPGAEPIRICETCGDVTSETHCRHAIRGERIVAKTTRVCGNCGRPYKDTPEIPFRERFCMVAVVGSCPQHGLFFKRPNSNDLAVARKAPAASSWRLPPRIFAIPNGPKSSDLRRHGIRFYWELFTERQLQYIRIASELLQAVPRDVRDILGLLVSTSLDFNSLLCGYKGAGIRRPGAVRHVFAHHAYSIPHTALENNPVSTERTSGTLLRLFKDRVWRGSTWAAAPREPKLDNGKVKNVPIVGEKDSGTIRSSLSELAAAESGILLMQEDARNLPLPNGSVDHVVTDPPYFDNVQYTDLSKFFRVWLGLFLRRRARWTYNPGLSAVAGDGRTVGEGYRSMMCAIWKECRRVLRPGGRLVFTFHHWRPKAWADLSAALQDAGARLVNYYVVESENPTSVHIAHLNALRHDCVLVLEFSPGDENGRKWRGVCKFNSMSSESFCRDCGETLGWILARRPSESENDVIWRNLLKGGRNAH